MNHVLNHMGHTWDVHRDFYRQYSSIIERLDVAKLLIIQDMNVVGDHRKKSLHDIDINEIHNTNFTGKSISLTCSLNIAKYLRSTS